MLKEEIITRQVDVNQNQEKQHKKINLDDFINPYVFGSCVGWVTHLDTDTKVVYVDYSENPFKKPLAAKLGRPFTLTDLEKAVKNVLDVRLDFENRNPEKPIITNVYYSILDNLSEIHDQKEVHIKGKRIVIEGDTEIIIKSGDSSTTYSAHDGKLVSRAVDITSEALHTNKIRGASIKLN